MTNVGDSEGWGADMGSRTPTVSEVCAQATSRRPMLHSRFLQRGGAGRTHVLETEGEEAPLLLLHGGGSSACVFLPLVDELDTTRVVAADRPGFGLSDPVDLDPATFRERAVAFVGDVIDGLGAARVDLLGNSMGGTWALWFALAHPDRVDRLVLLGTPPLLPGTRIPPPLRVMAAPLVGEVLTRLMPATPAAVRQMMGSFGEGDTIDHHPEVVGALLAAADDGTNAAANLDETRAVMTALGGFRPALVLSGDDLRRVEVPVLLVIGDHDPVGGADVGRELAARLPDARLEVLPTGHLPWLGRPRAVAGLVEEFVGSGSRPGRGQS